MTWKKNVTSLFLLFSNERCFFFAIVCLWRRSRSRSMSMHFHSKVKIAASGKDQPITILHIVWKWLKMSVNCVTAIFRISKILQKKLIVRQIIKTFFENFTEFWESYRISQNFHNFTEFGDFFTEFADFFYSFGNAGWDFFCDITKHRRAGDHLRLSWDFSFLFFC